MCVCVWGIHLLIVNRVDFVRLRQLPRRIREPEIGGCHVIESVNGALGVRITWTKRATLLLQIPMCMGAVEVTTNR